MGDFVDRVPPLRILRNIFLGKEDGHGAEGIAMWRSEEMELVQLWISRSDAHDTVDELGKLGCVEFIDLNSSVSSFQRQFISQVKRCDEMERRLRYFVTQVERADQETEDPHKILFPSERDPDSEISTLNEVEDVLAELEAEAKELLEHRSQLVRNLHQFVEFGEILDRAGAFLERATPQLPQPGPVSDYVRKDARLAEDGEGEGLLSDTPQFEEVEDATIEVPPAEMPPAEEEEAMEDEVPHEIVLDDAVLGVDEEMGEETNYRKVSSITGVMSTARYTTFERVVWRATRGNVLLNRSDILQPMRDPLTGDLVNKSVFVVLFRGERLRSKIRKICEAFGASTYRCPETAAEREPMLHQLGGQMTDIQTVLDHNKEQLDSLLSRVVANLVDWTLIVKREKAIYLTMNMFDVDKSSHALVAEGWVPKVRLNDVQQALTIAQERSGSTMSTVLNIRETDVEPPTLIETNVFTSQFQGLVDAYGIPNYREINPGVFAIITFPFLFAIMFGDFGHGSIMFLGGLFLVINSKRFAGRPLGEMLQMCYDARFTITFMGLFSMYMGLIYNEFFSLSFDLFYTNWEYEGNSTKDDAQAVLKSKDWNYPFGVDPAWKGTEAELLYYNSLKMKMSIIVGVLHMLFGLFMSALNHIYKREWNELVNQFIPHLGFFSVFVYLVLIVFYKWSRDWFTLEKQPPNLLNTLIYIFMKPGTVDEPLFPGQTIVQAVLLFVAIASIPWILCGKPLTILVKWHLYEKRGKNKKRHMVLTGHLVPQARRMSIADGTEMQALQIQGGVGETQGLVPEEEAIAYPDFEARLGDELENEGEDAPLESTKDESVGEGPPVESELEVPSLGFGDIMITQVIHTLEYVLGCISSTASYLRLWALSLAHSELSIVFYDRVFLLTINSKFLTFIGYAVWIMATILVLLCMETLSAMLHALRLHWVEFQNKFYKGEGVKFNPFNYDTILPKPKLYLDH